MKKLLIIASIPPPYHGSNLYNQNLLNSNLKNYFKIHHLDTSDKRSLNNIGRVDFMNIKLGISNLFLLVKIIKKQKPDIVYIPIAQNIAFIRDGLFIIIAALFKCKKIVIHLHGSNFLYFYKNSNFILKKFIDFSLYKVDYAIVLGESLRYIFKKWIDNIFIVPNGLNFSPEITEKKYIKRKIINIGFLGNLLEEKGIIDLINAFFIVANKDENVILNIAGDWVRKKDSFKKKVYHLLEDSPFYKRINFVGYLSLKEKEKFLLNTDIFVYPSWNEGQPLAILEAMASGCPIISIKDIGVISETIVDGENGILVDKRSPMNLANAIIDLIENEQKRINYGLNSRKRYEKFYTYDKHIDTMINVLEST